MIGLVKRISVEVEANDGSIHSPQEFPLHVRITCDVPELMRQIVEGYEYEKSDGGTMKLGGVFGPSQKLAPAQNAIGFCCTRETYDQIKQWFHTFSLAREEWAIKIDWDEKVELPAKLTTVELGDRQIELKLDKVGVFDKVVPEIETHLGEGHSPYYKNCYLLSLHVAGSEGIWVHVDSEKHAKRLAKALKQKLGEKKIPVLGVTPGEGYLSLPGETDGELGTCDVCIAIEKKDDVVKALHAVEELGHKLAIPISDIRRDLEKMNFGEKGLE